MRRVGRIVAVLGGRIGDAIIGHRGRVRHSATDDFGDEAAAEGS